MPFPPPTGRLRLLAVPMLLLLPCAAPHAEGKDRPPAPAAKGAAPAPSREEGARRAIAWLEAHVFSLPDASGSPRKPFTVAFAGLDFLLDAGTTVGPDVLGRVRRCAELLKVHLDDVERRSRDPGSLPDRHGLADSRVLVQYTWTLAAAAIFYAEAQARGVLRAEAGAALPRVATLLAEAQDPNGGFGHGRVAPPGTTAKPPPGGLALPPLPAMPAGLAYPSTLVSTTTVVTLGLALARPAMGRAADEPLARAVSHLRKAQLGSGNFPYDTSQRSADADLTGVGRTAGAIAALRAAGLPVEDPGVAKAARFLDEHLDALPEGHGSPALNLVLGALAARTRGPKAVEAFDARVLSRMLALQAADGALDCICERKGFGVTCDSPAHGLLAGAGDVFTSGQTAYVTALHAFVLLLPRGGLRILDAPKGPAPRVAPPPTTTPGGTAPAK